MLCLGVAVRRNGVKLGSKGVLRVWARGSTYLTLGQTMLTKYSVQVLTLDKNLSRRPGHIRLIGLRLRDLSVQ
jgi:CII-binding regulator of phage lambda lysogenization HflD